MPGTAFTLYATKPVAVGDSDAVDISEYGVVDTYSEFFGTGSASVGVKFQFSADRVTWIDAGSAFTLGPSSPTNHQTIKRQGSSRYLRLYMTAATPVNLVSDRRFPHLRVVGYGRPA